MSWRSLFQTEASATTKARSPIEERRVALLRCCDKLGYTDKHYSDILTMFQEADDALFRKIKSGLLNWAKCFMW